MKIDLSRFDVRVLIVDDQVQMRKSIARILESIKIASVVECSSGVKALHELKRKSFDLVITDIIMEKMDGFELIEQIRSQDICCDVPIIAVSGESSRDQIIKANRLGATAYLIKPFTFEDLTQRVYSVLSDYFYPPEPLGSIHQLEKMLMAGDYFNGLKTLLNLEISFPSDNRIKYLKILYLHRLGRSEEALQFATQCVEGQPSYYRFHSAMAEIHLGAGRDDEACHAMSEELHINPKNPNRQVQLGHLLLKMGRPKNALYHFKQALQDKQRHKQALQGAGKSFAASGDLEKAIAYMQKYRRYHPDDTKPFEYIVKFSLEANQPKTAELALKQEINGPHSPSDAYIVLAKLYLRLQRLLEAKRVLEQLLAKELENPDGLSTLGEIEYREKNFSRAEELLSRSVRIQPTLESLHLLAKALIGQKKYAPSCTILERALMIDAKPNETFQLLGSCHLNLGDYRKALLCLNLAMFHGQNSADCQRTIDSCKTMIQRDRDGFMAS